MATTIISQEYSGLTTDIIGYISNNFLDQKALKKLAVVNILCNEVASFSKRKLAGTKIAKCIYSYMCRKELSKFPIISSLDQSFYEITPVFWVILYTIATKSTYIGETNMDKFHSIFGPNVSHNMYSNSHISKVYCANSNIKHRLIFNRKQTIRNCLEKLNSPSIIHNAEELLLYNMNSNEFFAHLLSREQMSIVFK
jgi:hypothetical protein